MDTAVAERAAGRSVMMLQAILRSGSLSNRSQCHNDDELIAEADCGSFGRVYHLGCRDTGI